MPKLRFKLDQPHDVGPLDRTVQPDELVDVPLDVFKAHAWPETVWDVVNDGKKTRDKTEGA